MCSAVMGHWAIVFQSATARFCVKLRILLPHTELVFFEAGILIEKYFGLIIARELFHVMLGSSTLGRQKGE